MSGGQIHEVDDFDPYFRIRGLDPLLNGGPVRPARWSARGSVWVVSRYDEAVQVLSRPAFIAFDLHAQASTIAERAGRTLPNFLLFLKASLFFDGSPDHAAMRRLTVRALNAQSLSDLEPVAEAIAREVWRENSARPDFDLQRDFTDLFPSKVMAHVFGLTETERAMLSPVAFGGMEVYNRGCSLRLQEIAEVRITAAFSILRDVLAKRRGAGSASGALARMAELAVEMGVDEDRMLAAALFLWGTGVETAAATLPTALASLVGHPEQLRLLETGAASWQSAAEELLRHESTVFGVLRIATQDERVGSAEIRAGQGVMVLIGRANRDPDAFTDPDVLNLTRSGPPHLAFGSGAHNCLGQQLARIQIRAGLKALVEAGPHRLTGAPPAYTPMDALRRLRASPLQTRVGLDR